MDLLLHSSGETTSGLSDIYTRAIGQAVELYIVSAYLTEWSTSLPLRAQCRRFRLIVGTDFGITRRAACEVVLSWLPRERRGEFLIADGIGGFHPKAAFWREATGECFAVIGSSNLTRAAFQTNFEANVLVPLSNEEFERAVRWIAEIEKDCVPASEDWLLGYREASRQHRIGPGSSVREIDEPVVLFELPKHPAAAEWVQERREQLRTHASLSEGLIALFRSCAVGAIASDEFYRCLPTYWGTPLGNRLQGGGWQRSGATSNFSELSKSFVQIIDAPGHERDDVVAAEIDRLARMAVRSRGAFLSEMLCLTFPDLYPVRNKPLTEFFKSAKIRAPVGSSEGVRYVDLARKLRVSLRRNPDYPARNLAELDTVIEKSRWSK